MAKIAAIAVNRVIQEFLLHTYSALVRLSLGNANWLMHELPKRTEKQTYSKGFQRTPAYKEICAKGVNMMETPARMHPTPLQQVRLQSRVRDK